LIITITWKRSPYSNKNKNHCNNFSDEPKERGKLQRKKRQRQSSTKKNNTIKEHISKILVYSARKNNTNPTAEYSTLYPATNSDSASGRSKGTRLVSAKAETTNKKKEGKKGRKNHKPL